MAFVYVVEHGSVVGIDGGSMTIKCGEIENKIPKETIEGVSIFSKSQMTGQCIQFCLENNIRISYFTSAGRYLGSALPACSASAERIRKQVQCVADDEFALTLSKKIIEAKINNQLVNLKRHIRYSKLDPKENLFHIRNARRHAAEVETKRVLMGYEGIASCSYFKIISELLNDSWKFRRRVQRPAKDPFNVMLNLGYSLLMKEIVGELENRGINPYIGILHSGHDNCPALACDLIEEWRPVIVDSTVMSMAEAGDITPDMFEMECDRCVMSSAGIKLLLSKIEEKMYTEQKYLEYISKPMTFRQAIWHQAEKMGKAIDNDNPLVYSPIKIR